MLSMSVHLLGSLSVFFSCTLCMYTRGDMLSMCLTNVYQIHCLRKFANILLLHGSTYFSITSNEKSCLNENSVIRTATKSTETTG